MEEMSLWSKVLLTTYRVLPQIAKSLDKCSMALAMSGFAYDGDTYGLMEKMMELNIRKERLVNIKVIVDQTLERINVNNKEILELRFFKRYGFLKIADVAGVCIRTTFRRYVKGIEAFGKELEKQGYNAKWLSDRYESDIFISRIIDKVTIKALEEQESIEKRDMEKSEKEKLSMEKSEKEKLNTESAEKEKLSKASMLKAILPQLLNVDIEKIEHYIIA